MIQRFVEAWERNKANIRKEFEQKHPAEYKDLVQTVLRGLKPDEDNYEPFPNTESIHEIDDGDYQGTLLYVIPENTYQPSMYFCVKMSYGSCSVCDTLQDIQSDNYDNPPTESQVDQYMKLALHVVQGLKEI